jgi:hypothetical protein
MDALSTCAGEGEGEVCGKVRQRVAVRARMEEKREGTG